MRYKYSVLSETGNVITGVEEGSAAEVKARLKQKKYYILSFSLDFAGTLKSVFGKKRVSSSSLALLFSDMGKMLKSGIAVQEVVIALEDSSMDPVVSRALAQVNSCLGKGFSLTAAFEQTGIFPWLVLNMLKVGEKSGNLEQVFHDLSRHYERDADFIRSIISAVSYPAVVLLMLMGIMFYVSFQVIPRLEGLIPSGGNRLPATKVVIFISVFLKTFWPACLLIPVALVFIHNRIKKSKVDRVASLYYRIPFIGMIMKDVAFSVLFSNLAVLEKGGVSLVDSLDLLKEATPYRFLAAKIMKVKDYVQCGSNLWRAFEKDRFFPKYVYLSLRKGEEIGRIHEYLYGISTYYFDYATRRIQAFAGIIQPLLLVLCAAVLALIVLALIIPIYGNLSNIAGGNVKL